MRQTNPLSNTDTTTPKTNALSQWLQGTLGSKALTRSWWRLWVYPVLLVLTLSLSLATYLALDSIQQTVNTYVTDNQRALLGGDIVLSGNQEWPAEVLQTVNTLDKDDVVYDEQFSAMLITPTHTLLARLKGISPAYPLYGDVRLQSDKPFDEVLKENTVLVAPEVLTGLNAKIGDTVRIGEAEFTIADVLLTEPDRPLSAFGIGARVMMRQADLDKTELLGQRSRVSYRIAIAATPDNQAQLKDKLTQTLTRYPNIELSDTSDADTSLSQISDNVLLFLKLLVIAVLLLSAVAMYGIITAFVTKQQAANAMRLALGETRTQIERSYQRLMVMMALLASGIALLLSSALLPLAQPYMAAILPAELGLTVAPLSVLKTITIAVVLSIIITYRALGLLRRAQPIALLNGHSNVEESTRFSPKSILWTLVVGAGLSAFLSYEVASLRLGAQLFAALIVLVGVFWLIARLWLGALAWLAKRYRTGWMQRMAVHNLARKGNQSALFFVTLALSVAVLTLIAALNHSINTQFITAYPDDAPNIFLLDVQSEQHTAINDLLGVPVQYYPVIRARLLSANGVPAAEIETKEGFDDPTRVFNLSYTDTLMDTEFVTDSVNGDALYPESSGDSAPSLQEAQPLSILDTAAEMLGVGMGDTLVFNIQGIQVTGTISSIRTRYERGPSPFFYFLFEPTFLSKAPQIQFATAHVPDARISEIQGVLSRQFPSITAINGAQVAEQIQGLVQQMSRLVYVFTLLALFTGLMVLISSLLSTSQERIQDSASFRLLGMQKRDLYALNMLEIGVLGMSAAVFATALATAGAWLLITYWFDLRFSMPWLTLALGLAALLAVLLIIAIVYVRLVIGRGIMARVRAMI
ncbi:MULTISPECIES: ABC transporter permease [unclassified Psychrobacter]|uniref:ABC transporter permease n=1 Tax=unclassified Psychrobacter TaxID=196806 RepID=UPI0018F31A5F|nr:MULTISPECIES: FtsX-like permease family protein [unclassified Psychrobacter]